MPLHDDPGFITIYAGGEAAFHGHRPSILEFSGAFAKVPNVALVILCIPVERIFREFAIEINYVVYFSAGDAEDDLGFARNDEIVVKETILGVPFVNEGLAGWQRKERIGHVAYEIGRVDDRIVSVGPEFLTGGLARGISVLTGLQRVLERRRCLFSAVGSRSRVGNVFAFAQRN